MTTSATTLDRQPESPKDPTRAIDHAVLEALGRPQDFLRMTSRQVTANTYRVNVFTGPSLARRIAHSFFVTADAEGRLISSMPAIVRLY
jgi:hypothetical protein